MGYFHDYEPALEGTGWMTSQLDRWQEAGARRIIDFRELAAAVGCRLTLHEANGHLRLAVDRRDAPAAVRPIPVRVRTERDLPRRMTVDVDGEARDVDIEIKADGTARALVPGDAIASRFARPRPTNGGPSL